MVARVAALFLVVIVALCGLAPDALGFVRSAEGAISLRIVGAAGEDPPVVNERGRSRLRVVDQNGAAVPVSEWHSGDRLAARISARGVLKGRKFGFSTITAVTRDGTSLSTTAVVVRVRGGGDTSARGDTRADPSGNLYLSSPGEQVIYKTNGVRGTVFAGERGSAGLVDGAGEDARFNYPTGLGIDVRAGGALFVADTENNAIRRVSFGRSVTVVAGSLTGAPGTMTAGPTPIENAVFRGPRGVVSLSGNIVVADTLNHALFFVDFDRRTVSLLAGSPGESGLREGEGADALFSSPSGLAINADGTLLAVADTGNDRVRLVRLSRDSSGRLRGIVSTAGVASRTSGGNDFSFPSPQSVAFDGTGNIYVVTPTSAEVITRSPGRPDGRVLLAQSGTFSAPSSLAQRGNETILLDAPESGARVLAVSVGPPILGKLSVHEDTLAGGTVVTIPGFNFPPETRVFVGDSEATEVEVRSSRELAFRVPPQQALGRRTLSVVTRGGTAEIPFDITSVPLDALEDGAITTVAGAAVPYIGDGTIRGSGADVLSAGQMAQDGRGNVYFADNAFHRVRRIDALTSVVSTIAGTGVPGYSGDGGPALTAQLDSPLGIAVDSSGTIYVSDTGNDRVRRIDPLTGVITTVVERSLPTRLRLDGAGRLLVVALFHVVRYDPATDLVEDLLTVTAPPERGGVFNPLGRLTDIAVEADGAILVADRRDALVLRLDPETGVLTRFAGTGSHDFNSDGSDALATNIEPISLALDADGVLFIADSYNNRVFTVDPATRLVKTVAGNGDGKDRGDGGPSRAASVAFPSALLLDSDVELLVVTTSGARIRRITRVDNRIDTYAGTGSSETDHDGAATSVRIGSSWVATDGEGNVALASSSQFRLYVLNPTTNELGILAGGGDVRDGSSRFEASILPNGLAVTPQGRILFPDTNRIWALDRGSEFITPIAGRGTPGPSGDGGPALESELIPLSITSGPDGSVYICDVSGNTVRRIDPTTGIIDRVAGSGVSASGGDGGPALDAGLIPFAVAISLSGELFIIDNSNHSIRRVDPNSGIITSIPRVLTDGQALAVGPDGALYTVNASRILRTDLVTGEVRVVAGTGVSGWSGDGGPALEARFGSALSLAFTPDGTLLFTDPVYGNVRAVKGLARKP